MHFIFRNGSIYRSCLRNAAVVIASAVLALIIYYAGMLLMILIWGVIDLVGTRIIDILL